MKDWINKVLGNEKTPEAKLETDGSKMLDEVNTLSEVTAFAMARADDKYDELTSALARHEALGEQAAEMVRAGDETSARRLLALQLETQARIKSLQDEYSAMQSEAEQKATQFLTRKEAVEKKIQQLPKLQDDARMIRQQEEIDKQYSALSLQSAERSFDQTTRDIEMKKRQLSNRDALLSDPNAALDRQIEHSLQEREVDRALAALKQNLDSGGASTREYIEGEVVEGEAALSADPVAEAKQLLSAQRYKGVLPQRAAQASRVEK